ncbi:hypothetical protein C5167_024077 [Papaver somniferum]|uniref:HIT-type domain-containing protein n=1 Tax=Papaver somniferum TaxID=3469 RepID=A0A4Y7JMI9_PAPSO|nr:zinc finger HIT domain-containing protein 3-like isoform X1 [Papaver somniferum]RZC62324.1 hypothetical protein C5167_024077 [Papaver somniferum]
MAGGTRNCEVCKDAISKYKCPSCFAPYCSITCYKKHKETPCSKQVASNAETPSSNQVTPDQKPCPTLLSKRSLEVEEPDLILPETKLQSIVLCNEIRDALKDEKLRQLIYNIDSATNSENELENAMKLEDFRILSEKILSVIER